jgi:hypothetical protein
VVVKQVVSYLKRKRREWFKEWIDCDIERLRKENDKAKWWAVTFAVNSVFCLGIFIYSFENDLYTSAFVALAMMIYMALIAMDKENDRNRIDMWIFLKENVKNDK